MNKRRLKKAIKRALYLPLNKQLHKYLANKARHFYYKLTNSTKVAYPSTIMIELTNHCNLKCTTCPREYTYGDEMDKGTMKLKEAKRIIDEAWPYLDSVGLTGLGETFLYKEMEEMASYIKAKNKGIIISVSTNAMLPNFIERVKPVINKIDTIQISIDGLGDVYDKIRINANFDELDHNLRALSALCKGTETTLMLNMVVTEENYHQMPDLVKYCEEVGIDYMDFSLFNLASVTDIDRSYYQLYKSEPFLEKVTELEEVIKSCKKVYVTNRNFKTENGFKKCYYPWSHFYITWDGYVPPCCAKPFPKEKSFGNVFSENLIDTLNSPDYLEWREMWYKNIAPDFCDKCHLIDIEPINTSEMISLPVLNKKVMI
jgi:radical SAM protein with 4Fe4S-binding SPASM domain